ncbi:hypothetical protein CDAR_457781 [Caerostris darwini]|uniref:Uncharacterized protein n=1 Tax=Caerostris darwini TaxID=1538125 RepID=A0AAV4U4N2_9ARAC|nr:hypothetical protein CDAR_457781 [Caerostris darwini]
METLDGMFGLDLSSLLLHNDRVIKLEVTFSTTDEKRMLTCTDENPENLGRVNRNDISLPKPAASIPLLQSHSSLDSGN